MKNTVKKFAITLLAVSIALLSVACGGKNTSSDKTDSKPESAQANAVIKGDTNVEFDSAALEKEIITDEKVKFSSEMEQIPGEAATFVLAGIESGEIITLYAGGSTPNTFAIIKTDDADAVVEELAEIIKTNRENTAAYTPSDVAMIDNAIVKVSGEYVIYCVTNDFENARTIIEKY